MGKKRVKAGTSKAAAAARRLRFIEAYIANGGNATQAAISVGFPQKSAHVRGAELVRDSKVAAEIKRRRDEVLAAAQGETELSVADTLRELRALTRSDLRKCFDPKTGALLPPHLWPDDVASAMASVKVVEMAGGMKIGEGDGAQHIPLYTKEVKFWDKNAAIDKAMKHLGLYEKDNEQGAKMPGGVVIEVRGVAAG